MNEDLLTLAKKMFEHARIKNFAIEPSGKEGKIFFVNKNGQHAYEIWEVSDIWSVSTAEGELIKKHEDFYFAVKALIVQLFEEEMDHHFNKKEEKYDLDDLVAE